MFTKKTTVIGLWSVYLLAHVLSGVLEHTDRGSVYRYELSKNSKFATAMAKGGAYQSATSGLATGAFIAAGQDLENCDIAARPMWVSQADESVTIFTNVNGITVFDCLSQKSGSDDDDDSSSLSDCTELKLTPNQFKQERLASDSLQRLMPCPLTSDDKMQCPAEANGGQYITDPTKDADFDDCSEHRTSSTCITKLNFYSDGYATVHELAIGFFIFFLLLLTIGALFANDTFSEFQSPKVELLGIIGVVVVHVTLVIIILMRLMYANTIGEEDGSCLGEYMQKTLGYTLEEESHTGDNVIGGLYLVVVALGIVFVGLNQFGDDAEKLGRSS